jgi:dihydrofolate synthase/folylpolyglutamate synthase
MTYAQAVAHLYALGPELPPGNAAPHSGSGPAPAGTAAEIKARRKFDLAHMRTLCAALGDPQSKVPAILIAGTNGKGSTAATLASILTAAGYRTGLYTSPHLIRINERIQLAHPVLPPEYGSAAVPGSDGDLTLQPISDAAYAELYTRVDEVCEQLVHEGKVPFLPSFFERLTAVAFLYFAGAARNLPADMVVLEVGLGGRLDATNVVEPLLSVITDIALDHQDYLGDTIAEIAREKCGILRANGTLITLPQLPEANQTIGLVATELNVRGVNAADYIPPPIRGAHSEASPPMGNRYPLRIEDSVEPGEILVDSPLAGQHQQRNLALALATAIELRQPRTGNRNQSGYNISNAALERGIRNTNWPGRLELLPPNLLLDVAHNPAGAWTLRASIAALPETQPRTLIFSCLRDKDLAEMSRILFPLFDSSADGDPQRRQDRIFLAPIPNRRASSVEELAAAARALGVPAVIAPDLPAALDEARAATPPGGLIIATGSVYLVGELRRLVLGIPDALNGVIA